MDKKKFIILLCTIVVTIFVSVFFSFWFFFGQKPQKAPEFAIPAMTPPISDMDAQFEQINKVIQDQQKAIDKFNKDLNKTINQNVGQKPSFFVFLDNKSDSLSVQSEELKDKYKISVNLKPFNNDAKNVSVKVKGNKVTISAKYKSNNKDKTSTSEFYQSLTLPSKVNAKAVKQTKQGDELIVFIPKA